MSTLSPYIEDVFVEFYLLAQFEGLPLYYQDQTASHNFYNIIFNNKQLTISQSNYILKILQKYKTIAQTKNLDYSAALEAPQWKNTFRTIDTTKRVWIERTEDKTIVICLKFPYQLKVEFDTEVESHNDGIWGSWDPERKIRILPLYDINIIQINEFVKKHGFEIENSFVDALSEVEEVWQNQDTVLPHSLITEHGVILVNSPEDADAWFNEHASGDVVTDLLLAKSMGYLYTIAPTTLSEKIAASPGNSFWIKNSSDFLELCRHINNKICIVLDRTSDTLAWLKTFAQDLDLAGIDRQTVKVCFRMNKDDQSGLNDWVGDNGFGGKVDEGNILIFNHKPAKWLFKEEKTVTLLVTNNLYPSTNSITKDWLTSHPCVIYLGDIKPSELRNQNIVEL